MSARVASLTALLWVSAVGSALADDAAVGDYGARATVSRPLAATNREDATAAGTEIDTRTRDAAYEGVDDVLLEAPGAQPMRTGFVGSFTSASLRGAEVDHTAVMFGEIPLTSADAAIFDLSTIPVELLDSVVVYRGGAPVWLGQSAIGGVLQLQPRTARGGSLSGTATAGSFSTYGLSLAATVVPDAQPISLLAAAGTLGTQGDFTYAFDENTWNIPGDDRAKRRVNADMVQGHGLVHASSELGPGELSVLGLGFERTGGEPGAPANPANRAHRSFERGLLGANYTIDERDAHGERSYRLQALAAIGASRSRLSDLYGELGESRAKNPEQTTTDAFGRLAGGAAVTRFLELTLVSSLRRESHGTTDVFARVPVLDSSRTSAAAGVETNLHGELLGRRVELRPSLRMEHSAASLQHEALSSLREHGASDTFRTYRLSLGVALLADLTLGAQVATGVRLPNASELFGDGVLMEGNAALRPERSLGYDVSLVDVTCVGDFQGTFELRLFDVSIEDQIVLRRSSFAQFAPMNLQDSHVQGVELGARTGYGRHLAFVSAVRLLDTEGKPGKLLPNRPRVLVFASPSVRSGAVGPLDAVRLFLSGSYASASWDDLDNASQLKPSQLLVDAGAAAVFAGERAELRVTVSDVFDRGGQDLRKYPLPGRSLMASFTYREDTL